MGALIVGDGIPDDVYEAALVREARALSRSPAEEARIVEQVKRAFWNDEAFELRREKRRRDAAAALALLLVGDVPAPPEAPPAPPRALRGRVFGWWEQIPATDAGPVLRTRTQWAEAGFSVPDRCRPFASIEYGTGRRHRRYDLFGGHQVKPKRARTAAQIAAGYARDLR